MVSTDGEDSIGEVICPPKAFRGLGHCGWRSRTVDGRIHADRGAGACLTWRQRVERAQPANGEMPEISILTLVLPSLAPAGLRSRGDPVVERKMDGALIPSALLRAVRRPALDLGFRIDTLLRRGERCCMVASNACASSPRLR